MAIARKVAYNVLFSSVSKVLSTVLALISIGFITRYLGKEGFGNYATVLAFLSFFAAVADLGLYHISTREISREGADEEKIIGNIFSLRIISSLAIVAIAPVLVMLFDYPAEVKKGILIVASSFVFSSSYQVLNGIFQKNLAMDKVAIGELIGKVIQVSTVILAVRMNLGFDWIVASLLFNMIASFLIVFIWSRKYTSFRMRFDFPYWRSFLKESLPLGIGSIIVFFYFKMDTILLSVLKTSADVGIYNAAYKVLENITFFPAMVLGLVMPIMSANIFIHHDKFEDIANKTFKFFMILIVPLVIGTLFLAGDIINLIGGGQFAQSADVLRVLVFALAAIFVGSFFNNILIAGNLQRRLIYIWTAGAVMNISLNLILIPRFSYFAAAFVSFATELLVAVLSFYVVAKKIKYIPIAENFFSISLSGFVMAIFLFFFSKINFIASALGSASIYFFFLWLLKAVKTSEILSLISKKGVEEYEEMS